jgi:hypothetical protein
VEDDRHAVRGGVHVRLQVPVAGLDGPFERGHRVLVAVGRAATMGERDRK